MGDSAAQRRQRGGFPGTELPRPRRFPEGFALSVTPCRTEPFWGPPAVSAVHRETGPGLTPSLPAVSLHPQHRLPGAGTLRTTARSLGEITGPMRSCRRAEGDAGRLGRSRARGDQAPCPSANVSPDAAPLRLQGLRVDARRSALLTRREKTLPVFAHRGTGTLTGDTRIGSHHSYSVDGTCSPAGVAQWCGSASRDSPGNQCDVSYSGRRVSVLRPTALRSPRVTHTPVLFPVFFFFS